MALVGGSGTQKKEKWKAPMQKMDKRKQVNLS